MTKQEKLSVAINIRVTPDDARRLDDLAARIRIASRHAIAREALRLGMEVLEADPARALTAPTTRSGRGRTS